MIFADIPNGTDVFVDANIFVYACAPDPQFGPPSVQLLERIEHNELRGFTSTHILSDVAHRLMSLEACAVFVGLSRELLNDSSGARPKSNNSAATTLVVALMNAHGLSQLASHDADFDRVPGITRFYPV
jgi:predicted nucleic acid-binding protein